MNVKMTPAVLHRCYLFTQLMTLYEDDMKLSVKISKYFLIRYLSINAALPRYLLLYSPEQFLRRCGFAA